MCGVRVAGSKGVQDSERMVERCSGGGPLERGHDGGSEWRRKVWK